MPGTVNPRTGKPYLGAGYAQRTINHQLTVLSGFFDFHAHCGCGPVVNPIPSAAWAAPGRRPRQPDVPGDTAPAGVYRQKVP